MDPFVIYDGYTTLREKFGDVLHHGDRLERLLNIAKVSKIIIFFLAPVLPQAVNARSMQKCVIAPEHQEFYTHSKTSTISNWGDGVAVGKWG